MESSDILRTGAVIGVATLAGHLIPLLPFVVLARTPALVTAIVLSGIALSGVGAHSAITLVGDWRRKGFQMLVIGLWAAAIGFVVGRHRVGKQPIADNRAALHSTVNLSQEREAGVARTEAR